MKTYQHYIDVRGEVLATPRGTTTAVAAQIFILSTVELKSEVGI